MSIPFVKTVAGRWRTSPASTKMGTILTPSVLEECISLDASAIVSYPPPVFQPLQSLTLSNPLQASLLPCAAEGISVSSPHEALNSVWGVVNDWLAKGLGKGWVCTLPYVWDQADRCSLNAILSCISLAKCLMFVFILINQGWKARHLCGHTNAERSVLSVLDDRLQREIQFEEPNRRTRGSSCLAVEHLQRTYRGWGLVCAEPWAINPLLDKWIKDEPSESREILPEHLDSNIQRYSGNGRILPYVLALSGKKRKTLLRHHIAIDGIEPRDGVNRPSGRTGLILIRIKKYFMVPGTDLRRRFSSFNLVDEESRHLVNILSAVNTSRLEVLWRETEGIMEIKTNPTQSTNK
ncbi:hypothetical protein ARMGADRAFT_1038509 [Armillaria gallica]|uniref:Uncharacterized protein n=1 Tax=Armillaria gallica TaxID=47427 RepID=A0A2H3D537_ARMGA|nr:hypothetical protein ARMGADRAFT_1038509 [Armillaria gallica]